MNQSEDDQPPRRRGVFFAATATVGATVLLLASWLIGSAVFGPGPADRLAGDLQQVETTGGTYLGKVTEDDGRYLRLSGPAIVTVQPTASGDETQFIVQLLATEPYGLAGDMLIARAQVIFVVNVASDSQLFAAYRQASGVD